VPIVCQRAVVIRDQTKIAQGFNVPFTMPQPAATLTILNIS
jgi:hypothetical protein